MLLKDLDWRDVNGPYKVAKLPGRAEIYMTKDGLPNETDKRHFRGPCLFYDYTKGRAIECDTLEAQCLVNHYMEPPRHDQDHA